MDDDKEFEINGAGCLFVLFRRIFKLIDRYVYICPLPPWFVIDFRFLFWGHGEEEGWMRNMRRGDWEELK